MLRPILVNVLSAVLLFLLALLFKQPIYDLLTPPGIPQYPLVCYAEPYPGETDRERRVDFFIKTTRKTLPFTAGMDSVGRVGAHSPARPGFLADSAASS